MPVLSRRAASAPRDAGKCLRSCTPARATPTRAGDPAVSRRTAAAGRPELQEPTLRNAKGGAPVKAKADPSVVRALVLAQDPLTRICAQLRGLCRDDNGVRRSAAETGPSWWIRQTCSKVQ